MRWGVYLTDLILSVGAHFTAITTITISHGCPEMNLMRGGLIRALKY